MAQAYARSRELTRLRLYLEAIEQVLAGRRKIILDRAPKGARRLLLLGGDRLWPLAAPRPAEGGSPTRERTQEP
jgi:hypothetical protein